MNFDEKVKFLRTLPQFKVIPISEVRAVAFAAQNEGDVLLGKMGSIDLYLKRSDIDKIIREYPDLKSKFE